MAAKSLNIPVFIHESDLTPGLANKIAQKFATKILLLLMKPQTTFQKKKCRLLVHLFEKSYLAEAQRTGKAGYAFMISAPF